MTAEAYEGTAPRKSTLADVAAAAGVSLATASKAINHQPRVSETTRAKVLAAARKVGYITETAPAAVPPAERSDSIGVITSDLIGRWSIPILIGAEDELGGTSNTVLLNNARGDAQLERNGLDFFVSRNVDGVLIAGQETNPRPSLRNNTNVPLVYALAPSEDPNECSVTYDNVQAGRLAVEHLISCGKSRIAIIGGSETFDAATDRLKGAMAALHDAGLEPVGPVRFNEWSESWGRAATRLLIDQHVDFDGVVCQNDQIARGCLTVLRQEGLEVPRDVAVIGHDDWQVLTLDSMPPLTSIVNPMEEIGHIAARKLLDAINGHPHHGVEYVPCRLVQRESTLPLR
ncbi:LacI family DNA-binding transcriptional regulator [Bifidobacterium sp. CP2]|uniref:LacI family DNA-binding transcriptional regulator n=1 Tax=Bifidobacterium TaxID=1678 RepID=UPI001BDC342B|nr:MULTISPECIES: LacI family DNA-binding transcriptional regulator [Bifidobacterium]MBT1181463.1 LacI family DNA-binding transcriptional regulator [Bifidobacterium sp. CP2]MBW3081600.1 LacI family DNA-binding transcriptional regulator [Bifidobacterium saguinibicoloris]